MNIFNFFFMLRIALKHWWVLVLSAIIAGVAAFSYFNYIVEPKFAAKGSIIVTNGSIIAQGDVDDDSKVENADISTSLNFAETVADILETSGIFKQLANETGNRFTYGQLQGMALVERRANNTLFIDVTFTTTDSALAVELVNKYLDLAPDYINSHVTNTASAVTKADYANEVYLNTLTTVAIAAVAAAAVVYLIIFLIYSSDAIIRDEESFRERFDIPVMGVIPDFANAKTKESKYYKYNRYYGYGYGGNKYGR